MKSRGNVYSWLEGIRKRPGMYIANLSDLEALIHGYYAALSTHEITEDAPRLNRSQFASWLYETKGLGKGAALGWSTILDDEYPDHDIAFEKFFEYIEEYKKLGS